MKGKKFKNNFIRIKQYSFPICFSIKYSSLSVFMLYSLFIKGANNSGPDCVCVWDKSYEKA